MTETTTPTECMLCIDGMTPVTTDLFGDCYVKCRNCQPVCPCCDGDGCFPTWTTELFEFITAYNQAGYVPAICHTCGGALGLRAFTEEERPA